MLATLSLVIRHEALARRGETIYRKAPTQEMGWGFVLLLFIINRNRLFLLMRKGLQKVHRQLA